MMFATRGNSMWSNQGESSMKPAEKVSLVMGIIIGLMGVPAGPRVQAAELTGETSHRGTSGRQPQHGRVAPQ